MKRAVRSETGERERGGMGGWGGERSVPKSVARPRFEPHDEDEALGSMTSKGEGERELCQHHRIGDRSARVSDR